MRKGSHASPDASPEERKRMKEAQLRASRLSYVTPDTAPAAMALGLRSSGIVGQFR
jgi:hypothetical protein